VDARRVALYNKHKSERGLSDGQPPIDAEGYRDFLVSTCCDTLEIRYRLGEQLVGIAIADRSTNALSAVYCYYDPDHKRLSLGTYSIMKQLELCRLWGLRHLYLGLYIAECNAMAYKAAFLPHERLLAGRWVQISGQPSAISGGPATSTSRK
jgi:arginine-tRNA-protein transferase